MSSTRKDPCKANACRIQACLKENNYQEHKCVEVLEQMRQCCLKWHKQSICCSGIDLHKNYITGNKSDKQSPKAEEKSS
ncbi:cx9C motif-containing protein 4 [Scaptodrosophila lebanonensis]|uniref:Cx9C motif-containing protein 4 n=1 Tax=Drosophila lebanonensis TaxID=7225 RepID=A0A6J2TD80_DROLE|nr:cx9C motif-containing protein 4 [Scaptodrosophila lebanonensis]